MLNRLHRTESFRVTTFVTAIITCAMLILMAPTYYVMSSAFHAELLSGVDRDLSAIEAGYRSEGANEAKEIIAQALSDPRASEFFVLEKLPNTRLAGNLPLQPPRIGTFVITQNLPAHGELGGTRHVLGAGKMLGSELYVFAGRDEFIALNAQERVLKTFAWVLAATLVVALGGGFLVSKAVLGRMDSITQTCRAIMTGRMSDRIPLRGTGGEFNMLVATINEMLDRISALMENVQQVSNDIAHDLRTPLSRLRNRLELALTEADTIDDFKQATARAIEDCEAILSTFSSLLRIGQIEAATDGRLPETVNLSDLLEEIVEIYRPVAEDGEFILTKRIASGLLVSGDRTLLVQLFANLVENALAHTPQGTEIGIELKKDGSKICSVVMDNGPGIGEADRKNVLQRFYRSEQSRSSPGSGLGLALVSAIAKYHSADLALEDNKPGLRVTIYFP